MHVVSLRRRRHVEGGRCANNRQTTQGGQNEQLEFHVLLDGREPGFDDTEQAVAETLSAPRQENITLFDATLRHGHMLARVDILEK